MIYFDRPVQQRVVPMLERHLAPGGYLFISHSESLNGVQHGLRWVAPAIYRRRRAHERGDHRAGRARRLRLRQPSGHVVGIGELAVVERRRRRHRRRTRSAAASRCASWIRWPASPACCTSCCRSRSINPERARRAAGGVRRHRHPAAVSDAPTSYGLDKKRAIVKLVGGAEIAADGEAAGSTSASAMCWRRGRLLWRNGVLVTARTSAARGAARCTCRCADGRVQIVQRAGLAQGAVSRCEF